MKPDKYTLYEFCKDGNGESGPHTSERRIAMYDTREAVEYRAKCNAILRDK